MGSALSLMHEKWLVLQHSVFGLWSNSQTDEELMEAEQQRQNEKFELMTKKYENFTLILKTKIKKLEKEVSLSKKELNKLIAENDGNIPIGSEEKKAIEILRKIRSKQHRIDDQYIILSKIEARVELLSYKSEQYTLSSMFRSLNFHSKQSVPNYNMDELADEWDEIDEETSIFKQENEDFHDNIAVSDRHLYDVDTLKDELLNYCNTQQLHHSIDIGTETSSIPTTKAVIEYNYSPSQTTELDAIHVAKMPTRRDPVELLSTV